ncbi:WD40 repeat domain-containing protein [Endozoicomonas sp. GU-1]|uniref:WD40 repeat domain-containing protein n=1 Tax=Endozoicomonas sp. GU-1 TaxID=3009078 RepID=UPI0022B3F7B0|nr:WD40 repeat domain-containing protein [Endozoicomonas sp. GU-1]WBA81026.1 WD40 repeat domain-containing protein [Endozoicomonas sp. GU-1]WBA88594.1 WD40 repeat domain-containing protein [Endozoicomonas sp. GU-1]
MSPSTDKANSETSAHLLHFSGIPLNKLGDISTHLSCGEIQELQKECGQIHLSAVTSRDIKENWPFKYLYTRPDKAETRHDPLITHQAVFSEEIRQMIECREFKLERKGVAHFFDGQNIKAMFSPSERHVLFQDFHVVRGWSCDDNGDWREDVVLGVKPDNTAIFSTSGHYAMAAAEGLCKVWSFDGGTNWLEQFETHNIGRIKNVQFSPIERALAITSSDHNGLDALMICVRHGDRGWIPGYMNNGFENLSFQFSPSGNDLLITSKRGADILSIDYNGQVRCQYSYPTSDMDVNTTFSPTGNCAVILTKTVGSDENTLTIIGPVDDKWQELESLNMTIYDVKFSNSARHLMIHTIDHKIRLWSVNDQGRCVQKKEITDQPSLTATQFSASEDIFLTHNSDNGVVQILNYKRSGQWAISHKNTYYFSRQACFSDDPASNCIMIREGNDVHVVHVSNEGRCQFKKIHSEEKIDEASISPSGRYVLTTHGGRDGLIARLWSFDSEGNSFAKTRINRPASVNNGFKVNKAIFSASEQLLRLYGGGGFFSLNTIIFWGCDNNGSWTERGVVDNAVCDPLTDEPVHSHTMLQILAGDEEQDGDFKIFGYDCDGNWSQKAKRNHGTTFSSGSFSPSGRMLLTCGDKSASIWQIKPEKQV